jgi:hypothetical protein
VIEFTLPIRTGRGLNDRISWRARAAKAKSERETSFLLMRSRLNRTTLVLPVRVCLCRLSAGLLDEHDNLPASLKHCVDGIADALGIKDNDQRVRWEYSQAKVKRGQFGVRVTVEALS